MNANSSTGWYLNFISITHICLWKDYFDFLQQKVAKNLTFGDKSIVKVISLGVVEIKIFDSVVHSLGGVAYVPKMC